MKWKKKNTQTYFCWHLQSELQQKFKSRYVREIERLH